MTIFQRERLYKKAQKSKSKFRISVLGLDKNGNEVAFKHNYSRFMRSGGGVHAEMHLMRRYGAVVKTIILMRIGSGGAILPIDPCPVCAKKAEELGIKIISVNS